MSCIPCAADLVSMQLVTKNTFIEFPEEASADVNRRSSSVPAAARLAGHAGVAKSLKEVCDGHGMLGATGRRSGCEESTEAGTDDSSATSEEEPAQDVAESNEKIHFGSFEENEEVHDAAESNAKIHFGSFEENEEVEYMPTMFASAPVGLAWSEVAVFVPMMPIAPTSTQSTRLSSNAKAWTPVAGSCCQKKPKKSQDARFQKQCETIATAVKAALAENSGTVTTEVVRADHGWNVIAHVKASDIYLKERFLLVAKEKLLAAASTSQNVYVLGYKSRPFVATVMGFDAMLGTMEDESQACWDTYSQGYCTRGTTCRWKHPRCSTTFSVMIKLSE